MSLTTNRKQSASRTVQFIVGVLYIALPLVMFPFGGNAFEPPKVFALRFAVVVLCAIWLSTAQLPRWKSEKWSLLLIFAGIYTLTLTISTLLSHNSFLSMWGTPHDQHGVLTIFSCLIVALFVSQVPFHQFLTWLVVGSVPVCLYGLGQWLAFDPLLWETDSLSPVLSTLGRSNFVGSYLAILLPFTLNLVLKDYQAGRRRLLWWGVLLLQVVCLLLTQARAGWLAGIAGIFIFIIGFAPQFQVRRPYTLTIIGLFALISIATFQQWRGATADPLAGQHTYNELRLISIDQRLIIWEASMPLVRQAGLFGFGAEQFTDLFETQNDVDSLFAGNNITVNDPHNIFLDQIIAFGWLGFLLFATLIITFFVVGIRRNTSKDWLLMSAMTAFLVQASFTPDIVVTTLLFWTMLGFMAVNPTTVAQNPLAPKTRLPKMSLTGWQEKLYASRVTLLVGGAILLGGFLLRAYNVGDWLRFTGDEARDAIAAFEIALGRNFPTQGPKVHIGFGHLGPAYYYLLAIPLFLTHGNPAVAGWLTAGFDMLAIGMLFFVVKRLFGRKVALVSAGLYAVSFQVVFYARWGWHPSLVPFFVFLLIYCCVRVADGEQYWAPIMMLAFSLALQFHLTMILFVVPIGLALWYGRKSLSLPIVSFMGIAGIYAFIPLISYEILNDFPNLRGATALFAFQQSEPWNSPLAFLLNSLSPISTTDIVHKSINLLPGGTVVTLLNVLFVVLGLVAWRHHKQHPSHRLIFASWVALPIVAMIVYKGFRPDYYLISWYAIPIILAALGLVWVWEQRKWRTIAMIMGFYLVGVNFATSNAYFRLMAGTETTYSFYHGTTLADKRAIVNTVTESAQNTPYHLNVVTWAWPNHQPYAFLLMPKENQPTQMWLHQSASGEAGPYETHWLDVRQFMPIAPETTLETIYIIKEPDSLPMPPEFSGAQKVGTFGATGVYQVNP